MSEKTVIRINWTKPMMLEDAITSLLFQQPGLYYITKLLYTREKSLYIGKSTYSVHDRLLEHSKKYEGQDIYLVRLGQIVKPEHPTEEILDKAESALIYMHGPIGKNILQDNIRKTCTCPGDMTYQIENTGDIFELAPIILV